jgi:hypothetical protein
MKFLKNKMLTILVVGLLIQGILIQSVQASDGIFFNISTAKRLATDIDYYKKTKVNDDKIIYSLKDETNKYLLLTKEFETKIKYLELDKTELKTRGDKFEKVYTTCTDDLKKCEESKPSRLTWFGVGFVSALIVGIVSAFAFRR